MSHNEEEEQRKAWQHFFLPGPLRLAVEMLIAVLLLVVINFATFESNFLHNDPRELTFTSYVSELFVKLLTVVSESYIATQVIIFILWAVVGMLVYILGFRLLQAVYGVSSSMNEGFSYVKTEKTKGIFHWLNTLHNFFLKVITNSLSITLFSAAGFLAFAFAVQRVQIGLNEAFPENILPLGLGILATIIGIRLVAMGMCLVMPRFARWYLA
jgi:hypothetical protein